MPRAIFGKGNHIAAEQYDDTHCFLKIDTEVIKINVESFAAVG